MISQRPRFDAVCFDCDSTLTSIEGIDELAERAGCKAEIAVLTEAAMNGKIPLEEVYAKRLNIVHPERAALAWLAERYADEIVSGAAETIATLRRHGKTVYVITGGLLQAVAEFARSLGFSPGQVHAVKVYFDGAGTYQGFDASSPLCRSNGKATICRKLAVRHGNVALVGDGLTDLAARAGGAYVVGYGGVAHREVMLQEADCYIASPSLTATLPALLTEEERSRS
ncbi:MAG: HAD-IB family phosphatase [Methyloceanibacter sp.]|uniref:HAD-IB family phosphatase n=1 Tax=Methyloceanibacter sp. TaxID=1965321 RepID=UPI003D9B0DCA